MKKIISAFDRGQGLPVVRWSLSLALTVALPAALWFVTSPGARAREVETTEMIQQGLPPGKTMKSASKPELLAGICAAAKEHREIAPEIARAGVSARHEFAGDIVATVLRCSPDVDCALVSRVVARAVRAAPGEAAVIDDAALAIAPDCADSIQNSTAPDGKEVLDGKEILDGKDIPAEGPDSFGGGAPTFAVPFPGSVGGGGGGFDPQDPFVLVCDNGTQRTIRVKAESTGSGNQIQVRTSDLADFLASHPGAFVGSCQPTPVTNP